MLPQLHVKDNWSFLIFVFSQWWYIVGTDINSFDWLSATVLNTLIVFSQVKAFFAALMATIPDVVALLGFLVVPVIVVFNFVPATTLYHCIRI